MRRRGGIMEMAVLLAVAALAAAGCGGSERRTAPDDQTDPCAERLHDLSGRLLLYYAEHEALPRSVRELDKGIPGPAVPVICPACGKAYVYDRDGLLVRGRLGKLILYDAVDCHSGMRWGIMVDPPRTGQPLVLRVVRLKPGDIPDREAAGPGRRARRILGLPDGEGGVGYLGWGDGWGYNQFEFILSARVDGLSGIRTSLQTRGGWR